MTAPTDQDPPRDPDIDDTLDRDDVGAFARAVLRRVGTKCTAPTDQDREAAREALREEGDDYQIATVVESVAIAMTTPKTPQERAQEVVTAWTAGIPQPHAYAHLRQRIAEAIRAAEDAEREAEREAIARIYSGAGLDQFTGDEIAEFVRRRVK